MTKWYKKYFFYYSILKFKAFNDTVNSSDVICILLRVMIVNLAIWPVMIAKNYIKIIVGHLSTHKRLKNGQIQELFSDFN